MFNLRSGLYMNPVTVLTTGWIKRLHICTDTNPLINPLINGSTTAEM